MKEEKVRKISATILVVATLAFILYAFLPFINALFGALILKVLFTPMYRWLTKKNIPKSLAAGIVLITTFLVVLVPIFITSGLLIGQVNTAITRTEGLENVATQLDSIPYLNFSERVDTFIENIGSFVRALFFQIIEGATQAIIALTIMYFLLYYFLVKEDSLRKKLKEIIPFNPKNTELLLEEIGNVSYSTVVVTGIIAVLQGTLLGLAFLVLGIPGAFFWGFIGAILSFLPIIGIPLIWIPAGIIMLAQQDYTAGIGILIIGAIISNIDNFIRPALNAQIGRIHPLVSLIGVFIGLPIFGMIGIIMGPLLLSYAVLLLRMFEEEYINSSK